MTPARDNSRDVEERIERLICRRLDGEIDAVEQAELDRILANDPAARDLFNDYHVIQKL